MPPLLSLGSSLASLCWCTSLFPGSQGRGRACCPWSPLAFVLAPTLPTPWHLGGLQPSGPPLHTCAASCSARASSQNVGIYPVPIWLSPSQDLPVRFLSSPQVCGLPQMVWSFQATKVAGFSVSCWVWVFCSLPQVKVNLFQQQSCWFFIARPASPCIYRNVGGRRIEAVPGKMPDLHYSQKAHCIFQELTLLIVFFGLCLIFRAQNGCFLDRFIQFYN